MTETINFIFDKILPKLWELAKDNVFIAWSVALTAIVAIVAIYKNTKQ